MILAFRLVLFIESQQGLQSVCVWQVVAVQQWSSPWACPLSVAHDGLNRDALLNSDEATRVAAVLMEVDAEGSLGTGTRARSVPVR